MSAELKKTAQYESGKWKDGELSIKGHKMDDGRVLRMDHFLFPFFGGGACEVLSVLCLLLKMMAHLVD